VSAITFDSATSFDFVAAADVTKINGVGSGKSWQGSLNSMVAGWDGSGQAIYAPSGLYWPFGGVHTVVHRIRISTAQVTVDQSLVQFVITAAGGRMELRLGSNGKPYMRRRTSTPANVDYLGTGQAWAANTFYNIEVAIFSDPTAGSFAVRRDGRWEPGLRKSSIDTSPNGSTFIRVLYDNPDLKIDDFLLYTGSLPWDYTDFKTDTNNNPRIFTRYPTADGALDNAAWTVDPLFDKIDETIASTADDITATGSGNRDVSFVGTALPAAVKVYALIHNAMCLGGGSLPKVQSGLAIDGVMYPHPAAGHQPASFEWYIQQRSWTESPADALEFTQASADATQLALRAQNGVGTAPHGTRAAHACLEVLYSTTAAVPTPTPDAPLFFLKHLTHHLARCWKVVRLTDSVAFYFTDHNAALFLWDDHLYEPASGMDASADRRESELREASHEFSGVISSDRITSADVRAGRYRDAVVTEYIVDSRYPWRGSIKTTTRWWDESTFSKEFWTAQLTGISRFLQHRVGLVATRTCGYDVFDPLTCRKSPIGFTYAGEALDAVIGTDRRVFQSDGTVIGGGTADDWFNLGTVYWTSGANLGFTSEVRDYIGGTTRQFELQLPLPFAPQVGDVFTAQTSCNKRRGGDCGTKYDNIVNFGGEPYMESRDRAMQTPTS
jgi:uncharacterized phage protein (TIGR02218 family)